MATYKKWTVSETDFIKNNHGLLSDEQLASKLSQMRLSQLWTMLTMKLLLENRNIILCVA